MKTQIIQHLRVLLNYENYKPIKFGELKVTN